MLKKICICLVFLLVSNFCLPAIAQVSSSIHNRSNSSSSLVDASTEYFAGDRVLRDKYKLASGDSVAVDLVIGDNDLAIKHVFVIGPEGTIYFPKVGEINLFDLTIPEAKSLVDSRIKKVFKEKYSLSFRLEVPRQVQVYLSGSESKPLYVANKRYVNIYGEVAKSGRFEYLPEKKFSDYISYAGGFSRQANSHACSITRKGNKYKINGSDVIFNGNEKNDLAIMPGDVINVPKNMFYFSDFASFAAMAYGLLAFYNTFLKN